jgi:hypothetical protein
VGTAAAAFLYLCEPSPRRLAVATGLLGRSVAYYRSCDRERRSAGWYSFSRIHAFMAYDWLYDALTPAERWRESRKLWSFFLNAGGSLDPGPDSQSPFDDASSRCSLPVDGRPGVRILRRG